MARVRSFLTTSLESNVHPTEVDCGYQTVTGVGGEVLLQLATFGSDERMSPPKVSQTLQLDREASAVLVDIIRTTFPGLG
jgi:hypothetical protein